MIFKNGHEIAAIYHGGKAIQVVYKGARIVWQAVRSCFGRGYWVSVKPWIGTDKWKNNN
jgi:hypothetical protein